MSARLDPFVFVAATRYAITRTLTGASETVAGQIVAHAETIRGDAGACGAILKEIDESMATVREPQGFGQSAAECERVAAAWTRAAEALKG